VKDFDATIRRGGDSALQEAAIFLGCTDTVFESLRAITARLNELVIPYAVAGGVALVAHGYGETTLDIEILVTPEGLQNIHQQLEGFGYIAPFKGSKQLRDADTGVRIEFLVTGQFPGDGKPKPAAFPDPAAVAVNIDGINYLRLEKLIELKLASGMTNPGRLKDLADGQELIRNLKLDETFESKLDSYVRKKFSELRISVASDPTE
jgi:hypothetical protein